MHQFIGELPRLMSDDVGADFGEYTWADSSLTWPPIFALVPAEDGGDPVGDYCGGGCSATTDCRRRR